MMKKTILLYIFILLGFVLSAQTTFYTLDFETAGGYTTSVPEFTDGYNDYFIRTDGTDFSSNNSYSGPVGTYFFAGMDLDGEGATLPLFLNISDIDITGRTNLEFRIYLAEDDDGSNQDWDAIDYFHIGYDIDNTGTFTPLLWVEATGASGSNFAPAIDTDFDGLGDGTEITNNFTQFIVLIPGTGTSMDIEFEFQLDAGDEDIAIDQIELVEGSGSLPLDANFVADQTFIPENTTVNFSDLTTGGDSPYTYAWDLDGDGMYDDSSDPNPSYLFSGVGTYTVSLKVIDNDLSEDIETKTDYIEVFGMTTVSDIASLRAGTIGNQYTLTGEAILTFQQDFRHQKYIQDATAGVLIDDNSGAITTIYSIGDGITGITGTLGEYGGMIQFVPSADPGAPISPGSFTITPQLITLNDLTTNFEDYESELVTINDVTFADAGGLFATGTEYATTDASGGFTFRTTFYDSDYIGGTIPTTVNVTALPNSRVVEGNLFTARSLADFTYTGLPLIDKAFAISSTEVDVYYNVAPPSVDAGDFYILGTETISFTDAVIDGTDPTIVHLTGASPAMVGDITLDELFDDGYGSSYQFYAGIMPIEYTNTLNPGGVMMDETMATFQGVVSATDDFFRLWISDAAGQYNGIFVYGVDYALSAPLGEEIIIAGVRSPYENLSELKNTVFVGSVSSGTPYGPDIIPGSDIDETILGDMIPAEPWEGQLVKIENFTVASYDAVNFDYACTWSDADVDYTFHIGDAVNFEFGTISLTVGASYTSVTGVVDYDNPAGTFFYRINPRDMMDIEISSNPATQLAVISVNNGSNPYTETDFDVVVQAQDIDGNPAYVSNNINITLTTNGIIGFVPATTTTGAIANGTSVDTLSGVQMTPAGTGITITANDDNPFNGLTSGESLPFDVVVFSIPDLIITEVMQNPAAVGDATGEWFEVFNNSASAVDMNGFVVKDNDSDSITIAGSLIVPAYGFVVFGKIADDATNGGYYCDYEYGTGISLANSADELVICLTDGLTEIDRIEWASGWPSPNGKSMAFAGFPNEENNNPDMWAYSTFREGTFDEILDDTGSPGAEGYDQILLGGFKLDLKAFLEGPYEVDETMSNYFRVENLLPMEQPFNPAVPYYGNSSMPWLYAGTEVLTYIPFLTTDWLLVELRDASSAAAAGGGTMVAQYPVLLSDTGTITSLNGALPLNVKTSFTNDMYVVIWSLNHLGVMNAAGINPVDGTTVSYDFSTGSGQVYGGAAAYKEIETGIWGLMSGDINGDQIINDADNSAGWGTEAGTEAVYQGSNLFLDNQIDNKDKNEFWVPNYGKATGVPN